MKAFQGREDLKEEVVARATELRCKGKFANVSSMKRGFTSVNWLVHDLCREEQFRSFAETIEIPIEIVYIQDVFFEGFVGTQYQLVPEQFLLALPVSVDLSNWWPAFFLAIMRHIHWSPIHHDADSKIRELYDKVIELYELGNAASSGWVELEDQARMLAQNATTYCAKWSGLESEPYVQRVLSYEFCSSWLVARACAFITKPSGWWARAVINRFIDTALADLIQFKRVSVEEGLRKMSSACFPELYDTFLMSLSNPNSQASHVENIQTSKLYPVVALPNDSRSFADAMSRDGFWDIIKQSRRGAGDIERQIVKLRHRLEKLTADELLAFDCHLQETIRNACRWDLWAAAYIINGGCSEDGFYYFLGWLIAQGKSYYESTLADPNNAGKKVNSCEMAECEEILYLAEEAYEKSTGMTDFENRRAVITREVHGTPWIEDQVNKLFPKLAKKFQKRRLNHN
jgi:hypothetical protein